MNRLRRFMYGRYGFDQLTQALVLVSLFFSIITIKTGNETIIIISYIPIAYAIFRMLSKNIQKRTQENILFCKRTGFIKNKFQSMILTAAGTKTHKYFKCAHCRQTVRVPRGKGKICITCPKCKSEFVKRT